MLFFILPRIAHYNSMCNLHKIKMAASPGGRSFVQGVKFQSWLYTWLKTIPMSSFQRNQSRKCIVWLISDIQILSNSQKYQRSNNGPRGSQKSKFVRFCSKWSQKVPLVRMDKKEQFLISQVFPSPSGRTTGTSEGEA